MPTTFDISEGSSPSSPKGSAPEGRGTGFPIDDYARVVVLVSLVVTVGILGFLLWGVLGNMPTPAWSKGALKVLPGADITRQMQNIQFAVGMLRYACIIDVIAALICAFRDETIGYVLVVTGGVFYAGFPYLINAVYQNGPMKLSGATQLVQVGLSSLWWIFCIPGLIWVAWDIVRRFQAMQEAAAIARVNMKYGTAVARQGKHKERFMGRCWELPYCRDSVRPKCPIYIRRKGPCWQYKEGCMCEERIVLQAVIDSDWKIKRAEQPGMTPQQAQPAAAGRMNIQAGPKALLSMAEKKERCRKCVIYNEHQRHKYKLMAGLSILAVPAVIYAYKSQMMTVVTAILGKVEAVTGRFSYDSSNAVSSAVNSDQGTGIQWVILVVLGIIMLSLALKLVEYLCFKLKI